MPKIPLLPAFAPICLALSLAGTRVLRDFILNPWLETCSMSETDSAPTWRKIDEHASRIVELEIASRIAADRIASAEKAMERFAKESADNRATILASISSLQSSVNTLAREQHMRMGASAATKWAVPVVLTVLTLLTAWDILSPGAAV